MGRSANAAVSYLIPILFLAFAAFVLLSNSTDWDYFYSTADVDLRSWFIDHRPPLWSYQFCGGATRIGDPQSFGLSPLFIPVALLGPVLGLKLLIVLATLLGWFALRETAAIVWRAFSEREPPRGLLGVLACAAVFSNYFLWQFEAGHVTFLVFHLGLILFFFGLKALLERIAWKEALLVALTVFGIFSGGFYHSAIFFIVPLLIPSAVLIGALFRHDARAREGFSRYCCGVLLGLLASSYKIAAVISYQRSFPRAVNPVDGAASATVEQMTWSRSLLMQALPTWKGKILGFSMPSGPWAIYESSCFHLLFWLFVFLAIRAGLRNGVIALLPNVKQKPPQKGLLLFLSVLLLVCLSVSLPPSSLMSLHHWLFVATHGSIRAIGRYQICWILLFFLSSTILLSRFPLVQDAVDPRMQCIFLLVLLLNFLTFKGLSFGGLKSALLAREAFPGKMQAIEVVADPDAQSYLYPAIHSGWIVPNCYDPLNRKIRLMGILHHEGAQGAREEAYRRVGRLPLVTETLDADCADGTYVTQNDFVIGEKCKPGTCFNLNAINIYQPLPKGIYEDFAKRLWCLR